VRNFELVVDQEQGSHKGNLLAILTTRYKFDALEFVVEMFQVDVHFNVKATFVVEFEKLNLVIGTEPLMHISYLNPISLQSTLQFGNSRM
jgi:hypothetical protein